MLHRVNQRIRSDYYLEIVGMTTLILGKAFSGLDDAAFGGFGTGDDAALGCFGVLSVGTGEDVRGCFDNCPVGAAAVSWMLVRS